MEEDSSRHETSSSSGSEEDVGDVDDSRSITSMSPPTMTRSKQERRSTTAGDPAGKTNGPLLKPPAIGPLISSIPDVVRRVSDSRKSLNDAIDNPKHPEAYYRRAAEKESLYELQVRRKSRRRHRMAVGAISGAAATAAFVGTGGGGGAAAVVVGGVATAAVVRTISKRREKKKDNRMAKALEDYMNRTNAAQEDDRDEGGILC